jgi:alkanesulfonate monooxygenase SsuD/methylene tetrahydromethanopterin reductase-like flavin-dependent oxidoreductase (luciferase family)
MDLRFGCLTGQYQPFAELLADWLRLEELGFDQAFVFDHFSPEFAPDAPLLECWTLLAALAARTSTIRVGTAVTNGSIRHPAILCKQAITVDQVSGGRLDLAIGSGYYETELGMLGMDDLGNRARSERLREVVQVLDRGLRAETVSHDGRHWRLVDVPMGPGSVQQPRVPIWVAAQGPFSIETAALYADVLVTLGDPGDQPGETAPKLGRRFERLAEACRAVDRDPAQMRRAYLVGWSDERPFGSQGEFAEFVGLLADRGVTDFILAAGQLGGRPGMERIAGWINAVRQDAMHS